MNGRTEGIEDDLSPWLCPESLGSLQPEIVVVGFQEIVELSPQQIMNSDPRSRQLWEKSVKKTLNRRANAIGGERYVLLRSGQLVGAALCVFVKASTMPKIKNVEGSVKKTGLSGMAGNKGAVAIRLDYASTPICFVTAHLAAGFANYDERNKDYQTIHHGLRFQRNRGIDDHDTVVWMGDFNYRVGLSRERAMDLIRRGDLETLYENDQLNLQMVAGLAFPFYSEARITFMPTYRFDLGKDEYDSSEKQRIPAWTDRVLRKGSNIRQLSYNSAPLRFSDHRPVFATFDCTVSIVNEDLRDKISREIYAKRKTYVGHHTANISTEDSDDEELMGYEAIEPGLPPASSDRRKWWLDNGKMARSTVQPPRPNMTHTAVLNPHRPSNPFVPTDEPDWVTVPRAESRLSSFSSLSTSPYENINHSTVLSSSASGPTPRKLPLALDPSSFPATGGRVGQLEDRTQAQQSRREQTLLPPPPPPRRQAGAAATMQTSGQPAATMPPGRLAVPITSSQAQRKPAQQEGPVRPPGRPTSVASSTSSQQTAKTRPAPPVAKKPAHLSSLSPTSSPKPQPSDEFTTVSRTVSSGRASVSLRDVASKYSVGREHGLQRPSDEMALPPKPPRRAVSEAPLRKKPTAPPAVGGGSIAGLTAREDRPRIPARKPSLAAKPPIVRGAGADLLGDDGGGSGVSGWAALQPST